jgi:hypothetical protein
MCGIDWAEAHHDVALVDDYGKVLVRRRVSADLPSFTTLLGLVAEYGVRTWAGWVSVAQRIVAWHAATSKETDLVMVRRI